MGLKQKIKNVPAVYNLILSILNRVDYFNTAFHRRYPRYVVTPYWKERIATVQQSTDNKKLHHIANAGKVFPKYQLLSNGLKITLGSYYDYGNTHLLIENRGVHEPQEEYAFGEVLKSMPSGACMIELGSYWAFYSMWFAKDVNQGKCIMIEPDPHKMNFGKLNFKLNQLAGTFDLGFISDTPQRASIPTYSVDQLIAKHHLEHIHILHSDIQGFEEKMLEGCNEAFQRQTIDYFFISTHSNELHNNCINKLKSVGYQILCDANLERSYSVDGLLVAKRPGVAGPDRIEISLRSR